MYLVKVLKTKKYSEDGFIVKQFVRDKIYYVRESVGRQMFADEAAERIADNRLEFFSVYESQGLGEVALEAINNIEQSFFDLEAARAVIANRLNEDSVAFENKLASVSKITDADIRGVRF